MIVQASPPVRRLTASLIGLVLMMVGPQPQNAAGQGTTQVRSLQIVANGETIHLPGAAVIQDNILMVPYQRLFGPLGIRATWDGRARTLKLVGPAGDDMELRAGDPYATVNGESRPVPIPLVAVLDRVLIPVQWVFETLGDATAYDPGSGLLLISPQITGISWRGTDAGLEVAIDGTGPLHPTTFAQHAPERLVVDFSGAVPKSVDQVVDVHEGPLATVRVGRSPSGTRIVFDLAGPSQFRVTSQIPGRRVLVSLAAGNAPPGGPPGHAAGYQPSAQKISDIIYQHLDGGGRLVIVANRPLQVTQRTLPHPDRIVIDVSDAVFLPIKKSLDINDGLVIQVRAAQFHSNPNVVRIVVELARPAPFDVHAETAQLLVDLGTATAGGIGPVAGAHGPVVVAVDAGHGGSDPGATGPAGVKEKDVVLVIAQILRRLLVQQHIEVTMVRDADVFVPLEDRAQIASRGGATMFVSIHANASTDPNANGTQTFFATPMSQPLALAVMEETSKEVGLAVRGSAEADFKVLVDSDQIPAILVETAFISNPREEQMLRDPSLQQAFAQGILKGIQRYLAAPQAATP